MMIVVPPSTLQKASWFFELSSAPFSTTVICRSPSRTTCVTTSALGFAKKKLFSGLLMPATVERKYPATPSIATTPVPITLPALRRRRTGLCRRGKSCPPGGSLANDWPVVL